MIEEVLKTILDLIIVITLFVLLFAPGIDQLHMVRGILCLLAVRVIYFGRGKLVR